MNLAAIQLSLAKEGDLIRDGFERGLRDKEILPILREHGFNRSIDGIKNRRHRMGLIHNERPDGWNEKEIAIIKGGFELGQDDGELVARLKLHGFNRSRRAVKIYRLKERWVRPRSAPHQGRWIGPVRDEPCIDYEGMDARFCAAMRAAPECPPEGIFKAGPPGSIPKQFYPIPLRSFCGSPANECALHQREGQ